MPRQKKNAKPESERVFEPETSEKAQVEDDQPPTSIDPYQVLSISRTATDADIKKAYRRLALLHHPDKVDPENRAEAHTKFQELVFAYGILTDPARRKIYDSTGSLEHTSGDAFGWKEYFDEMYNKAVTKEMIEEDKKQYRESGEERQDILRFYTESKGDLDVVFENVVHSNVLEDESRFRNIIDDAIKKAEVKAYQKYTGESASTKSARREAAKKEEKEAEELATKLGITKKAMAGGQDALGDLIRKRNAARMDTFLDDLEKKYATSSGTKKTKKPSGGTPTEEEFLATQKRIGTNRKGRAA
ncbi:DnaJ domain-containing protein [Lipomyces kononenkoae]|uniref:DnaJ domain-containing protein n=1 Tax=Lipomyces kononenkoae TaxID=34357 RepID=A0ACC3SUV3_LIPKO